jgi:hypothetical protein
MKKKNIKEKNKRKETFSAVRVLRKNNQDVLLYVDGIKNISERENVIRELIKYLDSSLLDRDAGNPGPKLIKQLKELMDKKENNAKEYELKDLIWWKGTETQIEHLFNLLINNDLIDKSQFGERFALISKHFKNAKGNRFKNKQLSQAGRNLGEKKPPQAAKLKNIVNEIIDDKE